MANLKIAKHWITGSHNNVKCLLCPHECTIRAGKQGICSVRKNIDGKLYTGVYGSLLAQNHDPIEKKPLYHFFPGKKILSVGTAGCNLKCFFCQNYNISQSTPDDLPRNYDISPGQLLINALSLKNNLGIAFTYNEPTIFFEFMYDTAMLFKENNLKTVMVTNGYMNPGPLREIIPFMDAFNVDLKAFNDSFYKKYTHSSLDPVKRSLLEIKNSGKHLEITFLVIPGLNDSIPEFKLMLEWIAANFGKSQVFHISRYFPSYLSNIPPTPSAIMDEFYTIASQVLEFVYTGNISIPGQKNTYCPNCQSLVIERNHYISVLLLDGDGACPLCGTRILKFF